MIEIIKEVTKKDLREWLLYTIDVEDKNLYEELNNPDSIGIFQLQGKAAEKLCADIKPDNFEDMNAVNALARPGPIDVAAPFFIKRKKGEKSPYPDKVNEILKSTHSTIIYQEQIMAIFHKIGGFTLEGANEVRNLMKKLSKADKKKSDLKKWDKIIKKFKKGCVANGITEFQAEKIANDVLAFSSYSFNRCFSCNCKIDRDNTAKWHPTIEEMFLTKNDCQWAKKNGYSSLHLKYKKDGYGYAQSLKDERLFINKIKDIYFQGERNVYLIKLENGKSIEVTKNHSFPVLINKEKFTLKNLSLETDLKVGDILLFNKEKYKLGRNRKNKEGLKIGFSKITEIKFLGKMNTYDVEMEAPYHTLCVNGIVAKNSHATCYTYIAAITLYLSLYFRKYFYSSMLAYEADKGTNLFNRMKSIKNRGFKIIPIDINKSKVHLSATAENNEILFGLSDINFISEDVANIIIENRPYKSVFDFIIKTRCRKVTSKVLSILALSGAFDPMSDNRKKLLLTIEKFWKAKKQIKIVEKLKLIWKKCEEEVERIPGLNVTLSDLRQHEKDTLGFNFFLSLFTEEKIKAFKKMKEQKLIYFDFNDVDSYSMKIPVCINSIRSFNDKNGNEMAFIDAEDINGNQQVIPIFYSYWKFIGEKIEPGSLYLINVYLDANDKVLFGQKQWVTSEFKISRMVRKI